MDLKKRNAAELDNIHRKSKDEKEIPQVHSGYGSFPKYSEYDTTPGKEADKKD